MPAREGWQLAHSDGAGPFVSRIVHRLPDGSLHTWTSRRHRKGRGLQRSAPPVAGIDKRRCPWPAAWAPARLGWWIAVLFMVGPACFALASFAGLEPDMLGKSFQNVTVFNAVFFAGSIFFTAAS